MLDIGSNKQLFIGPWGISGEDSYLVASMQNVTMKMNEPQATGERLLVYDKVWESSANQDVFQYTMGSVIEDGGLFRMYYAAFPKYPWNAHFTCYAESTDGIRWIKPDVGVFTWNGSTHNNIILPNDNFDYAITDAFGATVFIDPNAAPQFKYKLIALLDYDAEAFAQIAAGYGAVTVPPVVRGQYTFTSDDGVDWDHLSDAPVQPGLDDTQFSAFWDERIGKYVIYTRTKYRVPGAERFWKEYQATIFGTANQAIWRDHVRKVHPTNLGSIINERRAGRTESDDFIHFGAEKEVIKTDSADHPVLATNCPGQIDFHGPNVIKYSEAANIYIAMPEAMKHTSFDYFTNYAVKYWPGPRYLPMTATPLLMTSRDGISWNRSPQRKPFMPLGAAGSFWSKQIRPRSVVRVGDELWIYFVGLEVAQNVDQERKIQDVLGRTSPHKGAWSRAVLRLDGFISADTTGTTGEILTKQLQFTGKELQLNIDAGGLSSVKVEIRDSAGKPISGFTLAEADAMNADSVRAVASWKGSKDVSSLAGQTIQLRFAMTDAKLYAFQFMA